MAKFIEITDLAAPQLELFRLSETALFRLREPDRGVFIAESPKVIQRALDAGYRPVCLLCERGRDEKQAQELLERCSDIPAYTASSETLSMLTGYALTRGMLCVMDRPALPSVTEVLQKAKRVAVLERIMNPTNVGAIIRSAAALSMDAVLLTPGCSDPLYRRAIRVSMGTVFQIPWTFFSDDGENAWPKGGMELLHRLGFWTVSMALRKDSVSIEDPALNAREKLAVILGSEGDGLAQDTIVACDDTVCIPMSHGVDSLNVAAAGAVAFWQLGRRKEEKGAAVLREEKKL